MMRRRCGGWWLVLAVIGLMVAGPAVALDRAAVQELQFAAEHSGDAEVQRAVRMLRDRGYLQASDRGSRAELQYADSGGPDGDCELLVREALVKAAMVRELLAKRLPREVKELRLAFDERCIRVAGRLDGPLFLNPGFECAIDFAFLGTNKYRIRIFGLKVAGFKLDLFGRILEGYLRDALARVFINGCTMTTRSGPNGDTHLDVAINPNGLVPGIGNNASLSGLEMSDRTLRFKFTLKK